ncbi:MAG: GNAT family N-acetyltransferase [Gordonibacter pamelaeae]
MGQGQIAKQALRTAPEDYAAFEAVNLAGRDGVRVLDVGCFDGFNTYLKFAPYAGVARVVGVDPLPEAVAEAAARTAGDARFSFACSTFEDYEPEAGERFDLVYFSHVLQHLPDPQAALSKACRLLVPGGFVVVKTTDDAAKLSYPDPAAGYAPAVDLYERHVLPNTPHTACTDRCNGEKCYTLMRRAGLGNVAVRQFAADTCGKTLEERHALFERCVYFRRNVPACVDEGTAAEIHALVEARGTLFDQDDYYFVTQSFVAIGQKPQEGASPWSTRPRFRVGARGVPQAARGPNGARPRGGAPLAPADAPAVAIRPLAERDLGAVMAIEVASFRDPWTPLAFALDLRHNPCAHYTAAFTEDGLAGYLGWWGAPDGAAIVRVAVDPARRKAGVGRALVEQAVRDARAGGYGVLTLEVRAGNAQARGSTRAWASRRRRCGRPTTRILPTMP